MQKTLTVLQLVAFLALAYPACAQDSQPTDAATTPEQLGLELSRALQVPSAYTQIKLHATLPGIPANGGDAEFRLRVGTEGISWDTLPNHDRACRLTVVIAAISSDGNLLRYVIDNVAGTVPAERFDLANAVAFKVTGPVPLKTASVRIVVRDDQSGKLGGAAISIASTDQSTPPIDPSATHQLPVPMRDWGQIPATNPNVRSK